MKAPSLVRLGLMLGLGLGSVAGEAQAQTPGSIDPGFNATVPPNQILGAMLVQPDGKIVVGGIFTNINGTARGSIARLNEDGSLDSEFDPGSGATIAAVATGSVGSIQRQSSGKLIVSGGFTHYHGVFAGGLVRVHPTGAIDDSFTNNMVGSAGQVTVLSGDRLLVFADNRLKTLSADGAVDSSFQSEVTGGGLRLAVQSDGKILVAGNVFTTNGAARGHLVRLLSTGAIDPGYAIGTALGGIPSPTVTALTLQNDGKALVGGTFTNFNGTTRGSIVRLNLDGSVDSTFNTAQGFTYSPLPSFALAGTVNAIQIQADGKIIAAGAFVVFNNTSRKNVVRINSNGALDASFDPGAGPDNMVNVAALQSGDGKLVIGGYFANVAGTPRGGLARLFGSTPAPTAPSITSQPQPAAQSVTAGSEVTYTVVATGTAPLKYQWKQGNASLAGKTNAALTLSNVQISDAGSYTVVVMNSQGSVTSTAVTLNVLAALAGPAITVQPMDQTSFVGSNASFSVTVTGTEPLVHHWFFGGADVGGSATITFNDLQLAHNGTVVYVVVTNAYGRTVSSNATLSVLPAPRPPAITQQPVSQSVTNPAPITAEDVTDTALDGKTLRFRITDALPPFPSSGSYEVALSATAHTYGLTPTSGAINPSSGTWAIVMDSANFPFPVSVLQLNHSHPDGGLANLAMLLDGTFEMYRDPGASQGGQWTILGPRPGPNVTFTVDATGTPEPAYQWLFNGAPLQDTFVLLAAEAAAGTASVSGARTDTLSLRNVQSGNAGRYSVIVSNQFGKVTSQPAVLKVNGSEAPDVTRPTLTIRTPTAATLRILSNSVNLTGTAVDSAGVASVQVQKNGGDYLPANGTTNWSASIALDPGTNVLRVRALDLSGNSSLTNTRVVVFIVSDKLVLTKNGSGTVTGPTNTQRLELGKTYTLKAAPATGYLFSNWISGGIVFTNPTLTFQMVSNLAITLNLVPNPFLGLKGTYTGLFYDEADPEHATSGYFTFKLTDKGAYSGKLTVAGKVLSGSGTFDLALHSRKFIGTENGTVTLDLQLTPNSDQVTGSLTGEDVHSALAGFRAVFSTTNPATNFAGNYTMLLSGGIGEPSPAGHGFATFSVTAAGALSLKATLADGSTLTRKGALSARGEFPLHAPLYAGGGSIFGWLTILKTPTNDVHGPLLWTKPGGLPSPLHQAGFIEEIATLGARYAAPVAGMPVLTLSNGVARLDGGNLAAPLLQDIALDAASKVSITSTNPAKLVLTLKAATGAVSGSFIHSGTLKAAPLKGVLLPKFNVGGGFFLGIDRSGSLFIGEADDYPLFPID